MSRNPFRHIGEYIWTVLRQGKALVGGAVFSLITWALSQTMWAGGACLIFFVCFVAPFLAWREEYEKRLAGEANSRLPRFKGEITAIVADAIPYAVDAQKAGKYGTHVGVSFSVHNESPQESSIKEFVLTVPENNGEVHKAHTGGDSTMHKRGLSSRLFLPLELPSVHASDLNLNSTKVRIIDAFNEEHVFSVVRPLANTGQSSTKSTEHTKKAPKDQRPDIRGFASQFQTGIRGCGSNGQGGYDASAEVKFQIELSNHSPVVTNIADIKVDPSNIDPTMTFRNLEWSGAPERLEHGIVNRFALKALVEMAREQPSVKGNWPEQKEVGLAGLKIAVVDGFRDEHPLQTADGESIMF